MKKFLCTSLLILVAATACISQKKTSGQENFRDAEFFFDSGEYEEALYLFLQLIKDNPDNYNFQFRAGMSLLNIQGREKEAIPFLEKAVKETTLKYDDKNFQQKEAPHHAWFYLGNAYRIDNQLDKALECYESFMDIRNFESNYNLRITENEIAACQRAKIIQDSPVRMIKENPGAGINGSSHNYQPVVNKDETVMVFMQKQRFYDAIMYSSKQFGEWSKPINITPQLGSDGDMIPTGISPDGKELLLIKKTADETGDIYYSRFEGPFWTKAVDLGKGINSPKNEDHASFSSDGSVIVFSSDRRGGYGKLDLYTVKRKPGNTFDEPVNMGPVINSDEDETSAYLAMNDQQLYFSSSGHFNMGGFDIFFSEKNGTEWTLPVNLGYPVNTTGDNRFYQPVKEGNTGYIQLYNQEENIGTQDIYRIEMEFLSKVSPPANSRLDSNFSLELINKTNGELIRLHYDKEKQQFSLDSLGSSVFEIKIIEDK